MFSIIVEIERKEMTEVGALMEAAFERPFFGKGSLLGASENDSESGVHASGLALGVVEILAKSEVGESIGV